MTFENQCRGGWVTANSRPRSDFERAAHVDYHGQYSDLADQVRSAHTEEYYYGVMVAEEAIHPVHLLQSAATMTCGESRHASEDRPSPEARRIALIAMCALEGLHTDLDENAAPRSEPSKSVEAQGDSWHGCDVKLVVVA